MAVWQDLVSDHGLQGGIKVRRFAYKLRGTQVPQARAVIVANENLIPAFGTLYPAAGYRSPEQLDGEVSP
jgi:hypothetical protein